MGGNVARMGEMRSAYRNFAGKSEGKRSDRSILLNGSDLKEIGCEVVDWIHVA